MFAPLKSLAVALTAAVLSLSAWAAVDVNKADQAQLEAVKGIGPAMSSRVLDARKSAPFKDWPDLIERVKGIGPSKAGKLSAEGLTVNGSSFAPAGAAAPAAKAMPAAEKK